MRLSVLLVLVVGCSGCLQSRSDYDKQNFERYDASEGLKQVKHKDDIPVFSPAEVVREHEVAYRESGTLGRKWYLETSSDYSTVEAFYDEMELQKTPTPKGIAYVKSLDSGGVAVLTIEILQPREGEKTTEFTVVEKFTAGTY